jgi:hypothetical protein
MKRLFETTDHSVSVGNPAENRVHGWSVHSRRGKPIVIAARLPPAGRRPTGAQHLCGPGLRIKPLLQLENCLPPAQ